MKIVFLDSQENAVIKNALRIATAADLVSYKHEAQNFKEETFTVTVSTPVVAY